MKIDYRADIDGLRAVAVLAVIAFHVFPQWLPGGFVGVDVFFVISGFLITRILIEDFSSGQSGFLAFYGRRVLRIFPALLLVLMFCLALGWQVLLANEYKQLGKHTLAGSGFVSNIALWFEAGYFDTASETKPLLHLWSLGIEEQFYILWPLILWLALKLRAHLLTVIGLFAAISWCVSAWLVFEDRTQAFYAPWSRAWELGVGAALACAPVTAWQQRCPQLMKYAGSAGLALIAAACLLLHSHLAFPGPWALVPVMGAALVIAAPAHSMANARWLSHPAMVGIGLISYPLYLWHWPLFSFATIMEGGHPSLPMRFVIVLLCFVLAALTYLCVEKPLRLLPRRAVMVGLLLGMLLI